MSSAEDFKNQGNQALKEGKDEEAVKLYSKGLGVEPNHHVLLSNRAAVYLKLSKFHDALQDAIKCTEVQPSFSKGFLRKGQALYGLGRLEEAFEALTNGLKLEPNNEQIKNLMKEVETALINSGGSSASYDQDNMSTDQETPMGADAALPLLKIFNDPNLFGKIENHPELAKHLLEKDYVDALKELQSNPQSLQKYIGDQRIMQTMIFLMQVNPEMDERMRAERGKREEEERQRRKEEERKRQEEEKKRLEELNQQPAMIEKNLGNEYYKKKEFDKALEHYEKAIQLDPTNMVLYLNKAAVYMEQGDYSKCIKQCEEAIEVGKANHADFKEIAKGYARIGNAYFRQQNYTQALSYYTESITEHRNPEVVKKKQECEKLIRKLEEEAYINPEIATEHKNKGNNYFKEKKFPEAMKEYNEAIKRNPKDPTLYSNRAACYIKLGEFAYALKDAEKAIEMDPNFVKAYIRKAQCHMACKEYHKALTTYDQASKLDPNNEEVKSGMSAVMTAIQNSAGERDEQRIQNAMKDPEIAGILQDPVMQQVLRDFQNDPVAAQKHLRNPDIFGKIQKLIASGIIQTK
ncbi:hypothetical protein FDP41_001556 [Naegleria fowleri]|uniref:STI1 domain-containing protein n=1 Tax=Naegleria fowleri TaxID=5763 RepID=A0A6A5BMH5_NAEFO|nr:uncharacterized protein FDP41_001556 [Naegleria fowleri]KAF0979213.1 hypothetical protein FDP41_001556 [Naegleria fowleri]CAG4718518.1 unnamed protein product [Naegleria fowleri]